ncbi:MAG: 3' terminal RNA ribose 2'-O-methyltransferase Hen1 [Chloroflexota bacterium]
MILTITTTHSPSTDLGYLLHKNPGRFQTIPLAFGEVHVFFTEATSDRCTAALLLDVDPIGLVRKRGGKKGNQGFSLKQYVNDRPYVASSLLSVAVAKAYGTALSGRSRERQSLAEQPLPLEVTLSAVPDSEGGQLIRRLFEPLGYSVTLRESPLDSTFPNWGSSPYYSLTLQTQCRLSELLSHLYVLIPVLDNQKHYWVGEAEVEKLLKRGAGWLVNHPENELITNRYLKYQRKLAQSALDRLLADDTSDPGQLEEAGEQAEAELEVPLNLNQQRLQQVFEVLKASGANRVLDLGCGEGKLIRLLLNDPQFSEIVGLDVSYRILATAKRRLRLEELPTMKSQRVKLIHGSLVYQDARLAGFDACAVIEVIEHLDAHRLHSFEQVVFQHASPQTVIVTTPNKDYNQLFESLPGGEMRHNDHRFEWTRQQFQDWANSVAEKYGYQVEFQSVGQIDEQHGSPTQMGVFSK